MCYTFVMNTAIIITKTEPEIKVKAQQIAKELGVSLGGLMNSWLKQFVKTKKVEEMSVGEMDMRSQQSFYTWAKEDGALNIDNIAAPDKLRPYHPKDVRT